MIFDQLENIGRYASLSKNFQTAITFLTNTDVLSLAPGNLDIHDDLVYGFVKESNLQYENEKWETHKKYADIQMIIKGAERIGYMPNTGQTLMDPYNEVKDVAFHNEPGTGTQLTLQKGDFVILFPGELHRPDCPVKENGFSRKLVMKVHI
mgnify:CR=1 FL=1